MYKMARITVKTILPDLKTKGRVVRGWLGVAIQDVTSELAESLKLAQGSDVLVSEVVKGGPADTAGLRANDLIVEVNGDKIKDASHIVQLIISSLCPDEKTIVKVLRDSRPMTFGAIIAERKD